ncbi:MAG: signal peptide peptidase SppA [Pseudomonadota bacterium]
MFKRNKSASEVSQPLPGSRGTESATTANTNAILQELAVDYMHDKKIRRRWKMVLFSLIGLYFIGILFVATSGSNSPAYGKPHTALVELSGVIGTETGVTSDQINESLRNAFRSQNAKGVVLRINSPGGTPVQSAEINDEISRLRSKYPSKPMHVVVSDMAASGGYFVAVAAEKIFVNPSSIVGSIGVRMDSFGFVDAIKKFGIERRSLTAGENKAILDPFLPVLPEQRAHAKEMLDQVHQQFIDAVKNGRGDRISAAPEIYSGLFWSGEEAKRLGLVDEYGSLDTVAREVIGQENVVNYTIQPTFLEQFSREFGVAIGTGIANVLGGQFKIQ